MRASRASIARSRWVAGASLGLVLVLAACTTFRVRTDYDDEADFATLTSFAWIDPPTDPVANPFADNDLLRKRVREAVSGVLRAKGYREAAEGEADFLVTFHVTIENRIRSYDNYGYGYYYGGHPGFYGRGPARGSGYTASFQEGTLILDLLAGDERRLIWRGWGNDAVPTPDTDRPRIQLAVEAILERFPPEAGDG